MAKGMCQTLNIVCCALLLAACGGGGSAGSTTTDTKVSPGGIWTGTESPSGLSITGIVDEAGDFHFISSDGTQYVGTATTSGNTISANFTGLTEFGSTFADGSTTGSGTLTGTIQQRVSLSVTTQFQTANGSMSSGTLALTFNPLYDTASSLATISGNYTDPTSGDIISITSSGAVTWQDSATGCVGNGVISIIDAAYNAYQVQFSYGNCTGEAAVLNGAQFTGLATLNNTVSPEQAIVGVTGQANGTTYALVLTLNSQ